MKKLLWIGDAGCPSGFAKATHAILDTLHHQYDVTVLGLNYRGDPHNYPYPIYAAAPGGDSFGVGRLIWTCDIVKPDVIVIQNDGWNVPFYMEQLRMKLSNGEYAFPEHAAIPVVAVVAVDGKNFQGKWLAGVASAIFWTQFALDEAREGGYKGPASVIPLGVDRSVYHPVDKAESRKLRFPAPTKDQNIRDAFIVGCVNRNQPRKRWDLLVKYFAEWITSKGIRDAYLYLHTAPTGDQGVDVKALAAYYGVVDRIALVTPEVWYGMTEAEMANSYNCFDVSASTSQGEGFGLTTLEAMACGVPALVPDWSGLGCWARDGAVTIPCTSTAIGFPYGSVIGGVADERKFIEGLHILYEEKDSRKLAADAALRCASEERFDWANIGQRYLAALCNVLGHNWLDVTTQDDEARHFMCPRCKGAYEAPSESEWADLGRPAEVTA
jgi:D-inositol-3-phosphate glycosyltransferase